ncbi:MAG: flagellar motor switch protein FliG [Burkholderiales bacterium]
MSDGGIQKSAILLMSLGEDEAAEVLKHLEPREVQKIGAAMATMKNIPREQIAATLDEFCGNAGEQSGIGLDSNEYVRSVLRKALGENRSASLIDRILHGSDTSGIEGLKWMDADTVAELIGSEHPQIIATILVHLERDQAAAILQKFAEHLRNDVILRIATLDGIQPAALRELNDVLTTILARNSGLRKGSMGGTRTTAEILNFMPSSHEGAIIESVKEFDNDLAQNIVDQMFVWENLMALEDRAIQVLLREVQSESLILALKGTSQEMRDKIFKNMSQRAAEMLKEDLEAKGAVRVSEVEAQQKEILKIVRRLSDEGQITLGGAGGEAYV